MPPLSQEISFSSDSRVDVYPFTRQSDGDEIVIGRSDLNAYVSLPPDAIEILDQLAAGMTLQEAEDAYRARHGETPDLVAFLQELATFGLVRPQSDLDWSLGRRTVKYHFTGVSEVFARRLFSPAAFGFYGAVVALAAWAVLLDPSVIPGRQALYFTRDTTLKTAILALLGYASVFVHEMGHLLAARATGVQSRMGLSNRLWMLVAETDMTGLWAVPRRARILPILAGPLTDLVSGSLLIGLLFAVHRSWTTFPALGLEIVRALLFVYMMRIFWQFFFFMRTDIYFLVATVFGCKSLMRDSRTLLGNLWARFRRSRPVLEQSYLTGRELRVVRAYSVFYLIGTGFAYASLLFITLPLMFHFIVRTSQAISAGTQHGLYSLIDALSFVVLTLLPFCLGLYFWIRSWFRKRNLAQAREEKIYA